MRFVFCDIENQEEIADLIKPMITVTTKEDGLNAIKLGFGIDNITMHVHIPFSQNIQSKYLSVLYDEGWIPSVDQSRKQYLFMERR